MERVQVAWRTMVTEEDEEGRRDETALSRRKQDEGALFRVQTAPSRTAKHHLLLPPPPRPAQIK